MREFTAESRRRGEGGRATWRKAGINQREQAENAEVLADRCFHTVIMKTQDKTKGSATTVRGGGDLGAGSGGVARGSTSGYCLALLRGAGRGIMRIEDRRAFQDLSSQSNQPDPSK
ncbi:MAG: hypothetical protein JWO20_2609 [Candidatus Angelobacter sp.]|nr:hypothetical protein [Candidatus Angelobacter sp.]